jgi:hypothetical protein
MKKNCRTCVYNKERTINSKNCLKGHRAVYGFDCKDYESKTVLNKYSQELDLTNKEHEQFLKIKLNYGYTVLRIIEVQSYKCAVVAEYRNYVKVIPFDENQVYPLQHAALEWTFKR